MNWEFIAGMAAAVTVIMAVHAFLIGLIVDRAIMKALLEINKEYITREEFDRHIERCPVNAPNNK